MTFVASKKPLLPSRILEWDGAMAKARILSSFRISAPAAALFIDAYLNPTKLNALLD